VNTVELIRRDATALVAEDSRFANIDPSTLPIEVWGPGFAPLIHLILGQQVSIEAADAMYSNLTDELGTVTPQGLLALDDVTMQRCGFTRMKAEYARGLAEACLDDLDLDGMTDAPDDEIVARLTALRGIGPWTAECYLLFCLGRRDLFPVGDLALRVGYQEISGLDAEPSESETEEYAAAWAPRRTSRSSATSSSSRA